MIHQKPKAIIVSTSLSQNRVIRSLLMDCLRVKGYDVFNCGDGKRENNHELVWTSAISTSPSLVRDIFLFIKLAVIFIKNPPILIISFSPRANLYVGIFSRIFRVNYITVVSGLGRYRSEIENFSTFFSKIFRYSIEKSSRIVTMNEMDYQLMHDGMCLRQIYRINSEGFIFDGQFLTPINKDYSKKTFLFLSRINSQKGIFKALVAFQKIRIIYPEAKISIAGVIDSSMPKKDRELLDLMLQAPGVEYFGRVTDADKIVLFSQSSYYLFPSIYGEGLPMTLLEAQFFYCVPVVISTTPGSLDGIHPDFRSFYSPNDEYLESILKNINYFKTINKKNFPDVRDWITKLHSRTTIISQYENILN